MINFDFVNYIYSKHRRFFANILLNAPDEGRSAYFKGCYDINSKWHDQDSKESKDLAKICRKFVPHGIWDEAVARQKFTEAEQEYQSKKSVTNESLNRMGIGWFELGSNLPILTY